MLIERKTGMEILMPLSSIHSRGACDFISKIVARAIHGIKELFNKMCSCGKKPVIPLPAFLNNPNPEIRILPVAPPIVAEPPAAEPPPQNPVSLPDDESERIQLMSCEDVNYELESFDARIAEYRENLEEQNRLAPDERDAETVETCQLELRIADAKLIALRARKAHLDQIQLPPEELEAIAQLSDLEVEREIQNLNQIIMRLTDTIRITIGEERRPLMVDLDRNYIRWRHLYVRYRPLVEARQHPQLSQEEKNAINRLSLAQVNAEIREFQARNEIVNARLDFLKVRKSHLERLDLSEDDLQLIADENRGNINFTIALTERDIRDNIRDMQEGEESEGEQENLDILYVYLIHLQAQQTVWNQLGPEVVQLPWRGFQQRPLTYAERLKIDTLDLHMVKYNIANFATQMNDLLRRLDQHNYIVREDIQAKLKTAVAQIGALCIRKDRLEMHIPQRLAEIREMSEEEVERAEAALTAQIVRLQEQLRNPQVENRRALQDEIDHVLMERYYLHHWEFLP